jgi:hypothetical protein
MQISRVSSEDGFAYGLCYQSSGPSNFCQKTTIEAVEGLSSFVFRLGLSSGSCKAVLKLKQLS